MERGSTRIHAISNEIVITRVIPAENTHFSKEKGKIKQNVYLFDIFSTKYPKYSFKNNLLFVHLIPDLMN